MCISYLRSQKFSKRIKAPSLKEGNFFLLRLASLRIGVPDSVSSLASIQQLVLFTIWVDPDWEVPCRSCPNSCFGWLFGHSERNGVFSVASMVMQDVQVLIFRLTI